MVEKKRVLLVIGTEMQNAGVPNVIMTLVRQLHAHFCFDLLQFSEKSGYFDEEFQKYGGEIYRVKLLGYAEHKLSFSYRIVQIKRECRKILQIKSYAAVHCHCGIEAGICLAEAKRAGIGCRIAHAHGMYIRKGKNLILRGYNYFCKKQIVKYATVQLACSKPAGKTLFLNTPFQRVLNPVDVAYYKNVEKAPHTGVNLLQIGYFNENKNQLLSVRLLQALRRKGIDAHLTFIGYVADSSYFDCVQAYIRDNKLEKFITVLPSDADKRETFSKTDYTLLPSRNEGLPLVALEAQAASVPCLMSDCLSRDADLGGVVFVAYNDAAAWTEKIMQESNVDWNMVQKNLVPLSVESFSKNIGEMYGT